MPWDSLLAMLTYCTLSMPVIFKRYLTSSIIILRGHLNTTMKHLKFQAEVGSQFNQDKTTIPYIGYIQGLYTIEEKHEGIVRLETYSNNITQIKDSFAVVGYTYRPLYPIAIKGEYQWHSLHEENKLLFSLSVLF